MKNGGDRKKRKVVRSDHQHKVDRISELCDEILISIISRLPLREATATSILSSRWRHLHTWTSCLDFPRFKPYREDSEESYIKSRGSEDSEERYISCEVYPFNKPRGAYGDQQYLPGEPLPINAEYMSTINSIFESHKDCRLLKEFKIHMPFMEGAHIERWLEFALTRKAESIDISILCLNFISNFKENLAKLEYFRPGVSNLMGLEAVLEGLKSIKNICFSSVQVDDEEVRLLVSNSPRLERLSISHSRSLRNVVIAGHSGLVHVDIFDSFYVKSIQVYDMINLVSLRYRQVPLIQNLKLYNVPKLTQLDTADSSRHSFLDMLPNIPYHQLQVLKLWALGQMLIQRYLGHRFTAELTNVKHLEFDIPMPDFVEPLFSFIEASPILEKVEVKFLWDRVWNKMDENEDFEEERIYMVRPKNGQLSPHLKELRLSGYLGCGDEIQLAHFVIKYALGLKKVIVQPCAIPTNTQLRRRATTRIYTKLRPLVPDSVDFVVII